MNKENLLEYFPFFASDWGILFKLLLVVLLMVLIVVAIYDRFIQREDQLLINYLFSFTISNNGNLIYWDKLLLD